MKSMEAYKLQTTHVKQQGGKHEHPAFTISQTVIYSDFIRPNLIFFLKSHSAVIVRIAHFNIINMPSTISRN